MIILLIGDLNFSATRIPINARIRKMKYNNTVIHTTITITTIHSELLFTEAVGLEMAIRKYYI